MVFGMSKVEREHRAKARAVRREAFEKEDLKIAAKEGKEMARIESEAAIAKAKARASGQGGGKGSSLMSNFNKFSDFAATVTGNIDKDGGLGVHMPGTDPFSQQGSGGELDDPYTPRKAKKGSKKEKVDYLQ
jgi:hypothetical protein